VLFGPIAAIVGGGAAAIVITGIWSRLFPQLGAAKTFDSPAEVCAMEARDNRPSQ
jgi:hypothetical protein